MSSKNSHVDLADGECVKNRNACIPMFETKRRVAALGPVGKFLDALKEKFQRTVESPMPENSTQTELRAMQLE
jgi:hypothetical protein